MLRSMGQLPAEERPKASQMINVVREKLTEQMDALDAKIKPDPAGKEAPNAKRRRNRAAQARADRLHSSPFLWCRIRS